ncbi:hypothetical protein [Buttiauxella gaviniae]|uniref:hypothetical protein n=1 Tax=Buttiauxella gaviniae TaxID=82990 RepID=UPI003C7839D5
MKGVNTSKAKFFYFVTSPFRVNNKPKTSVVRAWLWSLFIRTAMLLGYDVCLVGDTGTGKTYLLKRILPGRIISAHPLLQANDWQAPVPFSIDGIKRGPVGIDETVYFDHKTLVQNSENLKKRGFVYTAQKLIDAEQLAGKLLTRRVLIVFLGSRPLLAQWHRLKAH